MGKSHYHEIYARSMRDPVGFWAEAAGEIDWYEPATTVFDPTMGVYGRWFVGASCNTCFNAVDRHVARGRARQSAIIYDSPVTGAKRSISYAELLTEVKTLAAILADFGIHKGDRIVIYMPMCPEAAIAMLACARIGAIHSVVFGGFSSEAIRDRIKDSGAKMVITADGGYRRGAIVPLKKNVDQALESNEQIERVIVFRRANNEIHIKEGRDVWWHREMEYVNADCPPVSMDSEDPLYILYTSGSTGKPKGVLHTSAGYLLGVTCTTKYVFDLKDDDVYWCTADIGWVTGHSYIVYGPLCLGATTLMYEGAPNWPEPDRFWRLIEDYGVSVFYTAPTAIRAFMRWGDHHPKRHDLSSV